MRSRGYRSRKKGKWTGGTVPLGYETRDKKLVINKNEAQTVRTIFQLYLELRSFGKLVAELDRRHIVTKRRTTKVAKYQGGIPFTYGPLAYFLKNRIYLGETHHGGKWFKGEHAAILDRATFDQVQDLLKENSIRRGTKFSESGALLKGKLFDDKDNRMGPTFSSKNGVRYRFYIRTALRGRKHKAGSVTRISASEIESLVEDAVRQKPEVESIADDPFDLVDRVTVSAGSIQITLRGVGKKRLPIKIPWQQKPRNSYRCLARRGQQKQRARAPAQVQFASTDVGPDPKLVKAIVRAHVWLGHLSSGQYKSIEDLAVAAGYNAKAIRQSLRLAFLAPTTMESVINGEPSVRLSQIPKLLPLRWRDQHKLVG